MNRYIDYTILIAIGLLLVNDVSLIVSITIGISFLGSGVAIGLKLKSNEILDKTPQSNNELSESRIRPANDEVMHPAVGG